MEEAYSSIPKLSVSAVFPTVEKVHQLVAGVRKALEEVSKFQLELNLQISELQLKVHLSTPLEVREQRARTIQMDLEKIGQATQDCTRLLEYAFTMLMNV